MTTDNNEKMTNRTAILFPHSYLPGSARDRILSSFSSITVCQPWYMESAAAIETNNGSITIVRPPENLKPPGDFRTLLSENLLWMRQNQGHAASLLTGTGEDATWEIREAIRKAGGTVVEPTQENTLKWHLILHLERELEENRASADEMVIQMKNKKPPLEEALGEENPSQGLFEDLPLSGTHPFIDERHLKQILAAWFGLFGRSLPDSGSLLTISPDVLSYAAELFETGPPEPSKEEGASSLRTIHLPRPSGDFHTEKDSVLAGLSGKTLILVDCG